MDDGGAGVLAERQHALGCRVGVAKELQSHILVVLRSLRVGENLSHLLIVLAAKHKLAVVECLLGQQSQGLARYLDNGLALKLSCADTLFGQQTILSVVLALLEHRSILKIYWFSHSRFK